MASDVKRKKKLKFQKFYEVLPQSLTCKVLDTDIVYNFTCITKPINRTSVMRTRDVHFQPGVEITNYHVIWRDQIENRKLIHILIQVSIQLFRKFGATIRPILVKIDQDMCAFMNGINSRDSSMLKRVLNTSIRRKNGNYYDPCPLSVCKTFSCTHYFNYCECLTKLFVEGKKIWNRL